MNAEERRLYSRTWRLNNLEKSRASSRESAKKWRQKPEVRARIIEYLRQYRKTHKPTRKNQRMYAARWRAKNPDYFRQYSLKRYWKNPERERALAKKSREKRDRNPERKQRHLNWVNQHVRKKKAANVQFRLASLVRRRILLAIKTPNYKSAPTAELIGCSFEEYKQHMERLWLPGMTWDNHGKGSGKWHIDHIRPISTFDLADAEQQRRCFHYSNTQPLWEEDNLTKGRKRTKLKTYPCLSSTWDRPQKYFASFIKSSRRNGIEPQNFDSNTWAGDSWQNKEWWKKTAGQYRYVVENQDKYSHFLFCDSFDIICAAGWPEILAKFEACNSPIVFGSESYCWPKVEQAGLYPDTLHRSKFLNAGMWIGTSEAALKFLSDISAIAEKREQCDQGICVDAFLEQRHPIVLDTKCSLLFCMNVGSEQFLDFSVDRPRTTDTGEQPCFFHGNGGSDLMKVIECLKL